MSTPQTATTSPWWQSTPDVLRFPALSSDIEVDVAVVGGGIVGVLTAWHCAQAGAKVALIESNHLGTGDTGFSTAFLLAVPDVSFFKLRKNLGDADFQKLWSELSAARDEFRKLATEIKLKSWVDVPALFGSYKIDDKSLAKEWSAIKNIVPSVQFVRGEQAFPFVEAIKFPNEARFDPRDFIVNMLKHAPTNLQIFEATAVTSISAGQPIKLSTPHGTVTAKNVIVATGTPAELLPDTPFKISTSISYVITARHNDRLQIPDAVCWDTEQPYHYFRQLDGHTLMLGGADQNLSDHHADSEKSWQELEHFRTQHFPQPAKTELRWSGTLHVTPDELPIIGVVPGHFGLFVATGFSGNGMVMGAVASRLLSALVAGKTHPLTQMFSPARQAVKQTHDTKEDGPAEKTKSTTKKIWFSLTAIIIGLIALVSPAIIFFSSPGGQSTTLAQFSLHFFPLVGLYAFTLVWAQLIIGSLTPSWRKIWPGITRLHRWLGIFTLIFALIHPTLLFVGVGWTVYWARTFVAPNLVFFVWLGYFQLILIVTTASTALLMRWPWLKKHWRTIHLLNYLIFYSVLIHSLALGHNLKTSPALRELWYFYGLTVTVAIIVRLTRRRGTSPIVKTNANQIDLGSLTDLPDNQPKLVTVNAFSIVVIRSGQNVWAMDNRCSHAGGPLCEGALNGQTVTCPWHGSQFNYTTGAVVRDPALTPQRTYLIEVKDGRVLLTI